MIILKWIAIAILILIAIIVAIMLFLSFIYLCFKWGVVGYYRGKEAFRQRTDITTTKDKKRKYEKL